MENTETKIETENTEVVNKEATPIIEPETQEQINWKKFREAREVERKEKIAAEKRAAEKEAEAEALKAAMEAILNKPNPQVQNNYNQSIEDESEEQRIQRLVAQSLDAERKRDAIERQQREAQEAPQRIAQAMPDFHQVCSAENVDYLEYHYPEVAAAFNYMPDGFDKWSTVYKAVKKLVPNTDSRRDQSKAEKNFNKPQAMSIAGKTQVGDTAPQMLDDARKQANWARMQKAMRGG